MQTSITTSVIQNRGSSLFTQVSDQELQILYRTIESHQTQIKTLTEQNTTLNQENKSLRKRNDELKETKDNLVKMYTQCLLNIGSQIGQDQNKKNLVEKTLMGLDIQKLHIQIEQIQDEFRKKAKQFQRKVQEYKMESQHYIDIISKNKTAQMIQRDSYRNLIDEKTNKIDELTQALQEIQKIIKIDSKNLDLQLIKGKIAELSMNQK